jgi:tetratricopeptide (TPR) repeat protein
MSKRERWFERNEEAESLEEQGRLDEALACYQANDREGCDVPFTYERMAAILRKQSRYADAVVALDRAIELEKRRGPSEKLVRLEKRRDLTAELAERPVPAAARRPSRGRAESSGGVAASTSKGCGAHALALIVLLATAVFVAV